MPECQLPSGRCCPVRLATIALSAAIAAWLLWAAAGAHAAGTPVNAFPIPGGHVASPTTQITFRGLPASQFGRLSVTGSESGAHGGRAVPDSDGHGGSFIPTHPFKAGEQVTVNTAMNIVGGRGGTYTFTIASPAGPIRAAAPATAPRVRGDVWRFRSAPQLFPAAVDVTRLPHGAAPGALFTAPQAGPVQRGPEILGPYGGLVWWKSVPRNETATDFRPQTYEGKRVLTWWQGSVNGGVGTGQDEIYSSSYRPLATVKAGNGLQADLHEFDLTRQNTALVTAYYPVYWDTSGVANGSSHDLVLDAVAQEIDIRTGLVLWQWDSLDHVGVGDTYQFAPPVAGHPWDYFHINAVSENGDGSILISARNTWAVYNVSHQTAAINWTLGGKSSTFTMEHDTPFMFQHDARMLGTDEITIFDDGAGPPVVHKRSRGLYLKLDFAHKTATMISQDEHVPGLLANYEGSVEPLANGDDFVGWGQQPFMTEFNSRGRPVFDARFVGANSSYRAGRFMWRGMPVTRPSIATGISRGARTVYASWNGATQIAGWRVLGGVSASALRPVTSSRKTAFESAIRLPHGPAFVAVQALDAHGHVLATSKTIGVS
jgi:hypothetical protein